MKTLIIVVVLILIGLGVWWLLKPTPAPVVNEFVIPRSSSTPFTPVENVTPDPITDQTDGPNPDGK